ncbi:MAG: glycosyltransferase family 39 protein [bacterium]|nr:glycosyltransferase family 39 protein [bacterium]
MFTKRHHFWLGIIFCSGLLIRLLASWLQPAFLDEAFVLYVTKGGWQAMINVLRYDTHTPVYNVLMYPLVMLTDDIFWLRLPSALCGLGTIILSYHLACRYCSRGTALVLSAFMALSYNVWLADAQLRNYGPLTFLCTVQWLGCSDINRCGVPFAKLPWPRWRWPLYFITALLCSGIHVLGTIMQGVIALLSLWLPQPAQKRLLAASVLAITPCAVWFIICRTQSALQLIHSEIHEYAWQFCFTPLYLLNFKSPNDIVNYLGNYLPQENIIPYLVPVYLTANSALWIVFLYCGYKLGKRWRWEGWLLGSAFLAPLFAVLLSCLLNMQPYSPRYAVPMTLPFLLILEQINSAKLKTALISLILSWSIMLCSIFPFCHPIWNQYWQSTIEYIDAHSQAGDTIIVYNPYAIYSFVLAYDPQGTHFEFSHDRGYHVSLRQHPESKKLTCLPLSEALLDDNFLRRTRGHRLFLVLCQRYQGDNSLSWLNERFQITDSYHFPSLTSWADAEVCILENKR